MEGYLKSRASSKGYGEKDFPHLCFGEGNIKGRVTPPLKERSDAVGVRVPLPAYKNHRMKKEKEIVKKRTLFLEPFYDWEEEGVFNPTAIHIKDSIYLIYRGIKCENYSRLGCAEVKKDYIERNEKPLLTSTEEYEKQGIEDPRITFLENKYYILYTAFDGKCARVAVAESENFTEFRKLGIISPNLTFLEAIRTTNSERYKRLWTQQLLDLKENITIWDKDACLFPKKINGYYAMLHRLEPDIQIVYFENFFQLKDKEFWEDYFMDIEKNIVMKPKLWWEKRKIGAGTVPIETEEGWLLLYHGVDKNNIYRAGAALLDLKKPEKEIARLSLPLFSPQYHWEKTGNVSNVVFPTGGVIYNNSLFIYYGCADKRIGFAEISLKKLLTELLKEKKN